MVNTNIMDGVDNLKSHGTPQVSTTVQCSSAGKTGLKLADASQIYLGSLESSTKLILCDLSLQQGSGSVNVSVR